MRPYTELKKIFHDGWSHPKRVELCMCKTVEAEFVPGKRLDAWLQVVEKALYTDRRLKILDVATGPGVFACCYAQLGHECTGLDFSEGMIATANERAEQLSLECEFVHGDAENLPFPDETFDVVSSRHVLYTLPRPGIALRHWVRVLKPGGKMILIADDLHNRRDQPSDGTSDESPNSKEEDQDRLFLKDRMPGPGYYKAMYECPLAKHHTNVGVLWALLETAGLEQINTFPADEVYDARAADFPGKIESPYDIRRPHVVTGIKP